MSQILRNLPEPVSSLDDLCDKVQEIITKMKSTVLFNFGKSLAPNESFVHRKLRNKQK